MVESQRSSYSAVVAEAIGLRASLQTLWNFIFLFIFCHGTVRDTQVTPSTGYHSECQRRRSQVGLENFPIVSFLISPRWQLSLAPRAKAALAASLDALRGCWLPADLSVWLRSLS